MNEGLIASMFRGVESTGVALVKHGATEEPPEVYKAAICAFDFVNRPYMGQVFDKMEDYCLVIGHTRSATRGTAINRNAHPFQHGHITLAHNGTIDSAWEIAPFAQRPTIISVDSEMVGWAMGQLGKNEDELKVLEKCTGAYTLIWHNSRDGSLNIARNERKPLHFAFLDKENTVVWASEYSLLMHLLIRRGIKVEGKVLWPRPMTWYKFDNMADLRDYTATPYTEKKPHYRGPPHYGAGFPAAHRFEDDPTEDDAAWDEGLGGYHPPNASEKSQVADTVAATLELSNPDDVNAIKDYLRVRGKQNNCSTGSPTNIKKIQEAIRDLIAMGFAFNQSAVCRPISWSPYQKRGQKWGMLRGASSSGTPFIMHNVEIGKWKEYQQMGKAYVCTMNVRKDETSKMPNVVVVESPQHADRAKSFFRSIVDTTGPTTPKESSGLNRSDLDFLYRGPKGNLVSRARFVELTRDGCGNCTGNINPEDHFKCSWVGDPLQPICPTCTNDPQFWNKINQRPDIAERLVH